MNLKIANLNENGDWGLGIGFERLVMMDTGIENIRDVIPYLRFPSHADF